MREESSEEENVLKEVASVNDIIHTPVRLAIMIFLLPKGKALFTEVQKVLDLTAGNLSSHIKKLEENGLIEVQKAFIKAKPTTILYLTEKGVNSIQEYANLMTTALTTILEEKKKDKNSQKRDKELFHSQVFLNIYTQPQSKVEKG